MPEPWETELDTVIGSVSRLDEALRAVPKDQAMLISNRLRSANRTIWNVVNSLEAHNLELLYDYHSMIRKAAELHEFDIADVWIEMAGAGALKINHKVMLDVLRRLGVNPDQYREEE